MHIPKGAKLWKLDAEKFYVSGDHGRLIEAAFSGDFKRHPGKEAAEELLPRQFVETKWLPGRKFRLIKGAGQASITQGN